MRTTRAVVLMLSLPFFSCGGGGSSSPSAPSQPVATPTPTPVPTASVTATGAGTLILHPSLLRSWVIAMETPVRVRETGGGTADWNYCRMQIFEQGVEIERAEIDANAIRAAGFSRIAARSDANYNLFFRFNSSDFDRVDITLGFSDVNTGRQFEAAVPFGSFDGVRTSLTPISVPSNTVGQ